MRATSSAAHVGASCVRAERVEAVGLDLAASSAPPVATMRPSTQHVHDVGGEVVEDALVVRDQQDAELRARPADLVDAGRDLAERVDVEAGVGLVEHRDVGFQQRHLQDLVALLLAAGEALVEVALLEAVVHAEALRPLDELHAHLEHGEVVDALAARRSPGAGS